MAYMPQYKTRPGSQFWMNDANSNGRSEMPYTQGYQDPTSGHATGHYHSRTKPLIASGPADGFVRKIETIVEYTGIPMVNPMHERPPEVDEFVSKVQTEASQPYRSSSISNLYWRQTPNNNAYQGSNNNGYKGSNNNGWSSDHGTKRYGKASDNGQSHTKFDGAPGRNEIVPASREPPSKLTKAINDITTAVNYLKEAIVAVAPAQGSNNNGYQGSNNNGWTSDNETKRYGKPSDNGPSHTRFDGAPGRNEIVPASREPPSKLAKATNDSTTAVDYLKEPNVTLAPAQGRILPPGMTRVEVRPQHIDRKEAAHQYGGIAPSPVVIYTPTIDSKEAAWKYRGQQL